MTTVINEINTRTLPRSNMFRWASPMLWNGAIRNYQRAFMDQLSESRVNEEARENIRAAITMCGMENDEDDKQPDIHSPF